jgi:valyl-tRNA synthetase
MSEKTLTKVYDPAEVEERRARLWIDNKVATPSADSDRPSFSMVIPPPNITGALHLGHALNSTLQDILARYKRMKGYDVLWLPGIDHAGIATQNVVERQLAAEGVSRHEVGRDEFIERVWRWKEESGGTIINQLKRLGATCDWTRLRFTMDTGLSVAVREVFTRLYKEGLIYRGDYIINWCPRCHTALSDLEVQFEETAGSLYYFIYPMADGKGSLSVATTRPETMLGDTAVAVNPADERFAALIGKNIKLPLTDRMIPVVGDDSVSMEFGTGAVKVTPAHDFNDFDVSKRHDLPVINIMDTDARLNENAGAYSGLDRTEARGRVIADMEALGYVDHVDDYTVMLGSCYRCSTVVEPRLSKQWFVSIKPLAEPAIRAVEDGSLRFVPKGWENTYFEWMRNIRDWCISRQIWWGHRIPAWHCADCGHITVETIDPESCAGCGSAKIEQDSDVLDTWFSSALWPFSTLGWPEKTTDLERFYPTSVLSTSFDIIFFWVARMIMMGLKFMDEVPFKEIYIHALIRDSEGHKMSKSRGIRDSEGHKMSKSRGNVIDPLVMMDRFGTDAVRFTLAVLAAQGRDIKLSEDRIEGYRNFCNKIWNLARFTLMNVSGAVGGGEGAGESGEAAGRADEEFAGGLNIEVSLLSLADRWILTRRALCIREVEGAIDSYKFDEAARVLYRFTWHELCDWYVELSKPDLRGLNGPERQLTCIRVLVGLLKDTMKLLHPFMPFITEEIYGFLPGPPAVTLMAEPYPNPDYEYAGDAERMELVMDVIRAVRNIRTEMNVNPGAMVECEVFAEDPEAARIVDAGAEYIKNLAKVERLRVRESGERPGDAVSAIISASTGAAPETASAGMEVFVPMKGLIDFDAEIERIARAIDKVAVELSGIEKKLANENFVSRAPAEVVEKQRLKFEGLAEKKTKLEQNIERMKGFKG